MRFIVEVEMKDRWVPAFLGLLRRMESLGRMGSSRETAIYADGDGDFHPVFTIKSDTAMPSPAGPIRDNGGNQLFDAG